MESFKREVIPWIQYHLALDLYRIYAFYDSDDQTVINALKSLNMVHLIEMKASDYLSRSVGLGFGQLTETCLENPGDGCGSMSIRNVSLSFFFLSFLSHSTIESK